MLDPFCGCGTAVHAAQKLGRQWIGIDVTHLAIRMIENRLRALSPDRLRGARKPKDLASARDLASTDKHQFQQVALALVDAQPCAGRAQWRRRRDDGRLDF